MNNLDKFQKEVVLESNDLLVIAGPGSGKTTTLITKVNYLLEKNKPEDILLLSFTNKSVDDIKQKLKKFVYVTTFHKLAIDVLKYNSYVYKICNPSLLDYIIDEYFKSLNKASTVLDVTTSLTQFKASIISKAPSSTHLAL